MLRNPITHKAALSKGFNFRWSSKP